MCRPHLTSVRPDLRNGVVLIMAACKECGSVQVFNDEPNALFPLTGLWTECRACAEWSMFYALQPFGAATHARINRTDTQAAHSAPDQLLKLYVEPLDMQAVDKIRMRAEEGHAINCNDAMYLVRSIGRSMQESEAEIKRLRAELGQEIKKKLPYRPDTAADRTWTDPEEESHA